MRTPPTVMPLPGAIAALHAARRPEDIVITTMGAAREWMALGTGPLDFVFLPSSMGQATSLGLGLALARPDRRVIVANGDGSMLMNLGSLASIVAARVPNLVVIVFDNGVYEVTGQQPTAGAAAGRMGTRPADFAAIARACGFDSVFECSEAAEWSANARRLIDAPGPTFVALTVEAVAGGTAPHSPGPAPTRARAFMAALGG